MFLCRVPVYLPNIERDRVRWKRETDREGNSWEVENEKVFELCGHVACTKVFSWKKEIGHNSAPHNLAKTQQAGGG